MMTHFNIQQLFEQQNIIIPMSTQVMDVLRKTWIRPVHDEDNKVYVLQTPQQRKFIAFMLADFDRKYTPPPNCIIAPDVANAMLNRFYLKPYVDAHLFTVAGGFLARMIEHPEMDVDEIAAEHDIDVFYIDHNAVLVWLRTLDEFSVGIEKVPNNCNTFKISPPSRRPFLIQFSWKREQSVFNFLETFDLPMCQIALDDNGCSVTLGFCVVRQHAADAVVHVSTRGDRKFPDHTYEERRLKKYRGRGYDFAVIPHGITYYGASTFTYSESQLSKPKPEDVSIDYNIAELYFKNIVPKHYRINQIYRKGIYRDGIFIMQEDDRLETFRRFDINEPIYLQNKKNRSNEAV